MKRGDKVRVIANTFEGGEFESFEGGTGVIVRADDEGVVVDLDDGLKGLYFEYSELEKVE